MLLLRINSANLSTKEAYMIRFFAFILATLLSIHLSTSFAAKQTASKASVKIPLYQSSAAKKIIQEVSINQPMVEIIQKNNMIKVGLKDATGTVGWINSPQYQQAKQQQFNNSLQTQAIYMERQQNKGSKEATTKITAYQNGKKLDQKKADALLKTMQLQEKQQENQFNHLQKMMQQMMQTDMKALDNNFNHVSLDQPNQT